jgi:hypothetical protein
MKRKELFHGAVLTVLLALLCAFPLLIAGCGGDEEKVPVPVEPGAPAVPEQAEAEVPPVEEVLGPDAPVTLPVLRLMPESAVAAAAFPSISSLFDAGTTIAKRYVPPEQVDAALASWVAQAAQELSTPDAKTIMDVARQRGFDPDAPIGFFAEVGQLAAAFEKAAAAVEARKAETPAPAPEAAPDAAAPDAAESPASDDMAPPATPDWDDVFNDELQKALREQPPAWVAVWRVLDAAAAEASVKELGPLVLDAEGPLGSEETLEAAGVTVHSFENGRFAYALAGDRMFVGGSVPMLKESLARLSKPAAIRYGTSALPSLRRDEVVFLSRMDRITECIKQIMPVLAKVQGMAPYGDMQLEALESWTKYYTGSDPTVGTLTIFPAEETKPPMVVVRGMADISQHPGLSEMTGEIKTLRLSPSMPENTQLLFAQQLTPLMKEEFRKQWAAALPAEAQSGGQTAGALTMLNQVLDVLKDEIALGVFPTETGLPGVLLMAGLTDAEQAKKLMEGIVPTSAGEDYNGVSILNVMAPIPMVTIRMAYVGSDLVVGTDVPAMKGAIDRLQGKTPGALFAALDPPIDAASLRQGLLLVKSQLLTDVVVPLSAFAGGLGEAQQPIDMVTKMLREVRATNEVKQNLYESNATIYLK